MLSIFSYACLPFIDLLWLYIYSDNLFTLKIEVFFFLLLCFKYFFLLYFRYQFFIRYLFGRYFLPVCGVFHRPEVFILMYSNFFFLMDHACGIVSKKSSPNPRPPRFSPILFFSFVILNCIVKSMIKFELLFVKGTRL